VHTQADDDRTGPSLGSVVVPAHDEATVLLRTLNPLVELVESGEIELVVAANGCTDDTAELARTVRGAVVLELPTASKTAALNAADSVATRWPRVYLDADITVSAGAIRATLELLRRGDVLAARPAMVYALDGSSTLVRSFCRARRRLQETDVHLWGAGVFGLSEVGRSRFGDFPGVTGDDLYVDTLFGASEKAVIATHPVRVHAPRNVNALLQILKRAYRGNRELDELGLVGSDQRTTWTVARQLVRSVHDARSLADALIYALIVIRARLFASRSAVEWERDGSSRLKPAL